MTDPAPSLDPPRPRRWRPWLIGSLVSLAAASFVATRPDGRTERPADGAAAAPPGKRDSAPTDQPVTPTAPEERGFFADFFRPRGEAPASATAIGGAEGGAGPRKLAPTTAGAGGPPPLDPTPYDFGPAARRDPAKLAALRADTRARVLDGRWEEHLAKLRPGLQTALVATKADPAGKAYEALSQDPLFALGSAQALLIARAGSTAGFTTRTGPESLRQLAQGEGLNAFLDELLGRPSWMEACLARIKPEDELPAALKVWAACWNADPTPLRGKHLRLQVAFALVFDRELALANEPETTINPVIRYAFFRDAAEAGKLKEDLGKLPIDTLVWVVGAEVDEPDLHWALQETKLRHLPADDWAKAFGIVQSGGTLGKLLVPKNKPSGKNSSAKLSRTALAKIDEVDEGSLEYAFKFGGEAARFAVESARAFGIPAAVLAGPKVGTRAPATWFSFRLDARHWEMGIGRPAQGAASGTAMDPQTRAPVREFELSALTERRHDSPEAARCDRLRLLARLAGELGEPGRQQACLAGACQAYDRSLPAWRERLAAMATDAAAPTAPWATTLAELRRAFDDVADMRDLADEHEARFLLGRRPATEAVRTIQGHLQKLRREFPGRRDLYLAGIARAGRLLARDRVANARELSALYREALETCAGDMTEFRGLLADYFALVKGEEQLELRFLADAEHTFRRKVDLPPREFQEMTEELYVYFRRCGQGQQGLRLRKEGEKAKEAAEKAAK